MTSISTFGQGRYLTHNLLESQGIGIIQKLAKESLRGQTGILVSKTNYLPSSLESKSRKLVFTFSNQLLGEFASNPMEMQKPYQCALKFGFRGYSTGGKNGIFYIRKEDKGLNLAVVKLKQRHKHEIELHLGIVSSGLEELAAVKIVWHRPDGTRIVGAMTSNSGMWPDDVAMHAVFLDFARY